MKSREIVKGAQHVSALGVGCNAFGAVDFATSRKIVHQALDLGVTLFETADVYGLGPEGKGASEKYLGDILKANRKEVFIASKFGLAMGDDASRSGGSPKYIREAVEASLARLKTDYIDLYQLHHPDPKTPIEETMKGFDVLVKEGKIRFIGVSNHAADVIDRAQNYAHERGLTKLAVAEDEYSILVRYIDGKHLETLQKWQMTLMPFFPLASGLLTGKYARGEQPSEETRFGKVRPIAERYMTPEAFDAVDKLKALAEKNGRTLLEFAIGWLMAKSFVGCVIAGATKPEHVAANARAADVTLSGEEIAAIDALKTSIGKLDPEPYIELEKDLNLRDPQSYRKLSG